MEMAYLCPPGDGVFTVNTAKERKDELHQLLYKKTGKEVLPLWEKSFQKLSTHQGSVLLGICSDSGGGILRGANWGPLFIRNQLYAQGPWDVFDLGDIRAIPHLLLDKYLNEEAIANCKAALYNDPKAPYPVSPLSIALEAARDLYSSFTDKGPIGLGGDHSVSYPLVKAYLARCQKRKIRPAIIHFDAHTDLLPSRLGIDICFGSWAYHILQDLPSPGHLYQIGIRSSNQSKKYWEQTLGVQQFWAREILKHGPNAIADEIIKDLQKKQVDELYVSFDIDAIDARYASATGTPESGGPSPKQAMDILEQIAKSFPIAAADMVEVAPFVQGHIKTLSPGPDETLSIAGNIVKFFIKAINRFYRGT